MLALREGDPSGVCRRGKPGTTCTKLHFHVGSWFNTALSFYVDVCHHFTGPFPKQQLPHQESTHARVAFFNLLPVCQVSFRIFSIANYRFCTSVHKFAPGVLYLLQRIANKRCPPKHKEETQWNLKGVFPSFFRCKQQFCNILQKEHFFACPPPPFPPSSST